MSIPLAISPTSSRLRATVAWLAFLAVAITSTWPLATQLTTALPLGSEAVATVPLLNVWTVWWNADRAAAGFWDYWDAPIFYPTPTTFAFSEAQPTTVVVAPLVGLTGRPALAYNVYLLATLTLNGGVTFHLLRRTGLADWPAFWGGVLTQMLPFVCWQLGVLQLAQLWPTVWTLWGMLRWTERPQWRTAVEIGVAFGVTYASCNYYGLFAALLLAPAGLWLLRRRCFTIAGGLQFLLAGLIAAGLMTPLVTVQRRTAAEHGWERDDAQVISLSAHLRDYTDTPWRQWLDGYDEMWRAGFRRILPAGRFQQWMISLENSGRDRFNLWVLGPGWIKLYTAAWGAMLGLILPSRRRWTLFLLTFAGVALLLSLGPNAQVWGVSLYGSLRRIVPGLGQIRSPFRFAVFVHLAVAWLCVEGLNGLHPQHWWTWLTAGWKRRPIRDAVFAWLPMLVLSGVLLAENLPPQQRLYQLAGSSESPLWVQFLRDETPAGSPVICLPVPLGTHVGDYEVEAQWLAWSMTHRRPLLNGYSGYFPESYVELNAELDHFPDQGVPRLRAMGARYAAVDRVKYPAEQLQTHAATRDWELVLSDAAGGMDVYQLPQ